MSAWADGTELTIAVACSLVCLSLSLSLSRLLHHHVLLLLLRLSLSLGLRGGLSLSSGLSGLLSLNRLRRLSSTLSNTRRERECCSSGRLRELGHGRRSNRSAGKVAVLQSLMGRQTTTRLELQELLKEVDG